MRAVDLWLPCPSDPPGLTRWGDYHFGLALQQALLRAGCPARILYRNTYRDASSPPAGTSLLVLRGKYEPSPEWLSRASYVHRLLWVISWPSTLLPSELSRYSLVFVASQCDLPRLSALSTTPCRLLRQATAFSILGAPSPPRAGLLFAANCRGEPRPLAASFLRAGVELRLIGDGWNQCGIQPWRTQIANACLPALYRSSLAVLNDHHPDMLQRGYQSNRLYDALACGVPVITDSLLDCPEELADVVVLHNDDANPLESIDRIYRLRSDYPLMTSVAETVRMLHSFDARVAVILSACQDLGDSC